VNRQSIRGVGDRPKPSINGQPRGGVTISFINYRKRAREAVNLCVDASHLGDERTIHAKPGPASLLAGILFEDFYRYSASSETYCRGKSSERPTYDGDVTS
jgi:hypothetical protein